MKKQKALFTFALCLVSSFAAADSPTDAPLFPDNTNAIVVQKPRTEAKKHKDRDKKGKCAEQKSAPQPAPVAHPA